MSSGVEIEKPTFAGILGAVVAGVVLLLLLSGIVGNLLALVVLKRRPTKCNNKSYTFMLRYLLTNNLIGVSGILTTLIWKTIAPSLSNTRFSCGSYVFWRFFGVSGACIAGAMAVERFFAHNHPHSRPMTLSCAKKLTFASMLISAMITFLPLFGFGVYYDELSHKCLSYRDATLPKDIGYAYLFMVFGISICFVVVVFNILASKAFDHKKLTMQERNNAMKMIFFMAAFFVCWMPEMICIFLALKENPLGRNHWFFLFARLLLTLHFTLDPFMYVYCKNVFKTPKCTIKTAEQSDIVEKINLI